MNRRLMSIAVYILVLGIVGLSLAKDKNPKPGPLTGTWECTSHGGSQGDMAFTLTLEQEGETVAGSVSSPIGSSELSTASFKKKALEIHIDSDQGGNWLLTGIYKDGQLSGNWTHGDDKGTWEGKKQAPAKK